MATAQEILGVRIRAGDLRDTAEQLLKDYTERKLTRTCKSLEEVEQSHSTYSRRDQDQIGKAYRLFLKRYSDGQDAVQASFDTSRKARRLAWALCYRGQPEGITIARSQPHLHIALDAIENQWRWHSFFGVFDALLRTWDSDKSRRTLQEFLSRKLHEYEGSRPRLVNLKEHREAFFQSDGPTQLATDLINEGRPITEAWDLLQLPEHTQGYSYAAALADAYTSNAMRAPSYRDYIRPALRFLDAHDRQATYKRCLSKIILRLDRDERVDERENVLQVAFRKIGDPAHAPEWQPWSGATDREKEDLESARDTLNNWIAQRFITAFFNKVAMDDDRRSFWLRYAPHVTRFKVYGDESTKYKLRQDSRIRKYVNQRFGQISGGKSALLMQIKDRVIVEFGKVGGACYIHRKGAPDCPSFDERYGHIRELRLGTDFPLLMRYSGHEYRDVKDQGRFLHQHDWERRLDWWMQSRLGVEV